MNELTQEIYEECKSSRYSHTRAGNDYYTTHVNHTAFAQLIAEKCAEMSSEFIISEMHSPAHAEKLKLQITNMFGVEHE